MTDRQPGRTGRADLHWLAGSESQSSRSPKAGGWRSFLGLTWFDPSRTRVDLQGFQFTHVHYGLGSMTHFSKHRLSQYFHFINLRQYWPLWNEGVFANEDRWLKLSIANRHGRGPRWLRLLGQGRTPGVSRIAEPLTILGNRTTWI